MSMHEGEDWEALPPARLVREMRGWFPMVERGARVSLDVEKPSPLEREIVARDAATGAEILRRRYAGPASARPCDCARDLLRELLALRGAL